MPLMIYNIWDMLWYIDCKHLLLMIYCDRSTSRFCLLILFIICCFGSLYVIVTLHQNQDCEDWDSRWSQSIKYLMHTSTYSLPYFPRFSTLKCGHSSKATKPFTNQAIFWFYRLNRQLGIWLSLWNVNIISRPDCFVSAIWQHCCHWMIIMIIIWIAMGWS
jgi:hypothetical protein